MLSDSQHLMKSFLGGGFDTSQHTEREAAIQVLWDSSLLQVQGLVELSLRTGHQGVQLGGSPVVLGVG